MDGGGNGKAVGRKKGKRRGKSKGGGGGGGDDGIPAADWLGSRSAEFSRHGVDQYREHGVQRARAEKKAQDEERAAIRQTELETARAGHFERIYPTASSYLYNQFFEEVRPVNVALTNYYLRGGKGGGGATSPLRGQKEQQPAKANRKGNKGGSSRASGGQRRQRKSTADVYRQTLGGR